MTPKTRELVWNKYGHRCAYCGKPLPYEKMQVDHVWPQHLSDRENQHVYSYETKLTERYKEINRADYKLNDIQNLNPACRQCNFYKGGETLDQFRNKLHTLIHRCRKEYINKVAEDYGIYVYHEWDGKFFFEKYVPAIHPTLEFQEVKPERLTFEEFCCRELSKHGEQHLMKARGK